MMNSHRGIVYELVLRAAVNLIDEVFFATRS
jgi:hypothetical protein